jgi:hypothetical protein
MPTDVVFSVRGSHDQKAGRSDGDHTLSPAAARKSRRILSTPSPSRLLFPSHGSWRHSELLVPDIAVEASETKKVDPRAALGVYGKSDNL